jgi:ubiquinone/menaquinone biosynthesis C-methylase UbiE
MELRVLRDPRPKTWGGFWDIFGEMLVDFLDIQEGEVVFDIGTGGGSVLYPAAAKVGRTGRVIGVETCEHCANRTSTEIKRCKIPNAEVHFMDARVAEFEDNNFDCITAGFIGWDDYFDFDLLQYKKKDDLMGAICRLLKPGGKFGMSTWLLQEDLDWMHEFLTSRLIVSRTNYHIENEKGWRIILTEAGFKDIEVYERSSTFTYDSVDAWWAEMMDYDWIDGRKNSGEITDSICEEAFKKISTRVNKHGGVPFRRDAIFVIATL